MKRILIVAAAPLVLALPAHAQHGHGGHVNHPPAAMKAAPVKPKPASKPKASTAADPHAGHAAPADPHAGHGTPAASAQAPAADPHAGHAMPTTPARPADPHAGHAGHGAAPPPVDPHAGHSAPVSPATDPHAGHAGHGAAADPHAGHNTAPVAIGNEPPPAPPTDFAAERFFPASVMASARVQLRKEHGDVRWSKVMLETAEVRPSDGHDIYAWEGEASFGGDLNRFVLKTEGEGDSKELESAEVQALYGRAIGPYFNLQAGVRHDFKPGPERTYATVGVEGVAPYWFEVEGALFLSNKGDLSARIEGSYDFRLTQKLILEPRAEANLAASADTARHEGSGLRDIELGVRLRYALKQEFAPYVGIHWERKFGDTADFARSHGEGVEDTRFVVGLRTWF